MRTYLIARATLIARSQRQYRPTRAAPCAADARPASSSRPAPKSYDDTSRHHPPRRPRDDELPRAGRHGLHQARRDGKPVPAAAGTCARELGERLAGVALNRYPAPRPTALLEKIKRAMGVPAGCDVLLGNGSDELISMLSIACAKPGAKVLAPVPGFVMYQMSATVRASLEFVGVPLQRRFHARRRRDARGDRRAQAGARVPRVPEQPDRQAVRRRRHGARSSRAAQRRASWWSTRRTSRSPAKLHAARWREFDNVVVMRTVSKLGLAGIRLGYMVGQRGVARPSSTRCARRTTSTC